MNFLRSRSVEVSISHEHDKNKYLNDPDEFFCVFFYQIITSLVDDRSLQ